jgi:hypothetical protein
MDNPKPRLPITQNDLHQLKLDQSTEPSEIILARCYLSLTSGSDYLDMEPELLMEIGKKLADPDALVSGPNLLKCYNVRRVRGHL